MKCGKQIEGGACSALEKLLGEKSCTRAHTDTIGLAEGFIYSTRYRSQRQLHTMDQTSGEDERRESSTACTVRCGKRRGRPRRTRMEDLQKDLGNLDVAS